MEWQITAVPVTKSSLPPIDSYYEYVRQILELGQLTNFGKFAIELERVLQNFIGTQNCLLVANGTLALQLAIKSLKLEGEVVTTPFSFVATSASIFWEGCTPVLADIDPETLNIDPNKIEDSITSKTTGILATHIYGNPCDVDAIDFLAKKYHLRVIYDAAHCFGVNFRGKSLFRYGDISTASLHATKVFHTVEGGLVIYQDDEMGERLKELRNFGIKSPEQIQGLGINAKNSELHAAMGLCLWPGLEDAIAKRLSLQKIYDEIFDDIPDVRRPKWHPSASRNGGYYPVIFESEEVLRRIQKALNDANVFPRRYFYPCLSSLDYVQFKDVSISKDISGRILCLPLFPTLSPEIAKCIAKAIRDQLLLISGY